MYKTQITLHLLWCYKLVVMLGLKLGVKTEVKLAVKLSVKLGVALGSKVLFWLS